QRHFQFRHGAQRGGDEAVAVGAGPDAVVAHLRIGIVLHRGLDLWDHLFGLGSGHVGDGDRDVAVPAAVHRPTIGAHWAAPADHVVASPLACALGLEDDPAVDREDTLPG